MVLSSVERGVGAGAIGGVAYGIYVATVADPLVAHAEQVAHRSSEHAGEASQHAGEHAAEHGHEHAAAVSELTTALVSVGSGVLWGILLGAAFGLAYFLLEPELPGRGATRALVLAGAGFLTVSAVPWLVLPPAVPGVEQPVATNVRLAIYGALMVVGAATAAASLLAYRRSRRRGQGVAVLAALAPLLAVGVVLQGASPSMVATGETPAALVLAVRGTVVLSQAALWATIAASYCWLGSWFGNADAALSADATAYATDRS